MKKLTEKEMYEQRMDGQTHIFGNVATWYPAVWTKKFCVYPFKKHEKRDW